MWIKRQVINFKTSVSKQENKSVTAKERERANREIHKRTRTSFASLPMNSLRVISRLFAVALFVFTFSSLNILAQQTTPTPAPPTTSPQTPPAGTSTQQQQQQTPTPQPSPTQLPPNAPGSVVSPSNETQQSVQPQPAADARTKRWRREWSRSCGTAARAAADFSKLSSAAAPASQRRARRR
ncbi:MAG: hypothetical protein DMF68_00645 [Acidobacteria bacterium]|nr:MAG: hypothetical protein DMF68_00645 [Acidobacteriota bacterium]